MSTVIILVATVAPVNASSRHTWCHVGRGGGCPEPVQTPPGSEGVVSHAGSRLLADLADRATLTEGAVTCYGIPLAAQVHTIGVVRNVLIRALLVSSSGGLVAVGTRCICVGVRCLM